MNHLVQLLFAGMIRAITFLFAIGGIGCIVVLLMTFWEDLKTISGFED